MFRDVGWLAVRPDLLKVSDLPWKSYAFSFPPPNIKALLITHSHIIT